MPLNYLKILMLTSPDFFFKEAKLYTVYVYELSKHLFVIQKLSLIGSTSLGFAQNTLQDFEIPTEP